MGQVTKIQCDGPGCKTFKAESNHWLAANLQYNDLGLRCHFEPLRDEEAGKGMLTFCGVPCATRKVQEMLEGLLQ